MKGSLNLKTSNRHINQSQANWLPYVEKRLIVRQSQSLEHRRSKISNFEWKDLNAKNNAEMAEKIIFWWNKSGISYVA